MDEAASFAQTLKQRRKALDVTQQELAQQVGCAVVTIQRIEQGRLRPSRQIAQRLIAILDIPPDEREQFARQARRGPLADSSAEQLDIVLGAVLAQPLLPTPLTPLIGRLQEVDAVSAALAAGAVRLLTLTGPGGVGKTRLALAVAREMQAAFADGAVFVDLAPLSAPELVAGGIAQTLGLRQAGSQPPVAALTHYLRDKHLLLVLDNFEQVLAAAPVVAELLTAAPRLKVILTSRVVAGVYGEHTFLVPPLTLPDLADLPSRDELLRIEAVRLFVERAQAVSSDFHLTDANARAVSEICARLDGLPLAIELAAARIRLFGPQALLTRLSSRLELLKGGPRTLPARQQTLRATIDWSYALLDSEQQRLFRRLAVFVGGWMLEAAAAVCGTGQGSSADAADNDQSAVLEGLVTLLNQSLLKQEAGWEGEPRFRMLETIREYALERLEQSGEDEALRRAHAEYFLALAEAAEPQLYGPAQHLWLDRLETEHDNIRAALSWFQAREACEQLVRIFSALSWFWWLRGPVSEARGWMEQGLAWRARLPEPVLAPFLCTCTPYLERAEVTLALLDESLALYRALGDQRGISMALVRLGLIQYFHGDDIAARAPLEEALAVARTIGDKPVAAHALEMLGEVELAQGDYARATTLLEGSQELYRELGHSYELSTVLNYLGDAAELQGEYQQAETLFAEALAVRQQLGDRRGSAAMFGNLANVARKQGDIRRALMLFAESITMFHDVGYKPGIEWTLLGLAAVASAAGQPERAARLLGAEEGLRAATGYQIWPTMRSDYERTVATARGALTEAAWAAAWAEGMAMTLEQAISEALGEA